MDVPDDRVEVVTGGSFPTTRHSVLEGSRSSDPVARRRAFDALIRAYWRPTYTYLRLRWGAEPDDAQDLTQGFFARALEKGWFDPYDPERARFRTFVRTCLDRFVANERASAARLKRGGGVKLLSLDFATAEGELRGQEAPVGEDPERLFHREWLRSLLATAVEGLRERCRETGKEIHFELFRRYDLEGPDLPQKPTYAALAAEHGIPATQVTNWLAWARREFRRILLERLREITGSDAEFRQEARDLLGVEPAPTGEDRG